MELEFKEIDERHTWHLEYQEISKTCAEYNYTFKDAKTIENKDYNRYKDVSPYDHSRIKLKRSSVDYINACLVKNSEANRAYILAQGPLRSTSGHFWLMVWEQNCRAVLMLNRVIEKNIVKCHQYWPTGQDKNPSELIFEDVGLRVKLIEKKEATYYVVTKLLLIDMETETSREITHFHYTTWPDFAVPQSPAAFLNFLLAVRESHVLDKDVGPAVIHCSAGIGRSGTFCLVDSCLVMIEKRNQMLERGKIKQVLLELRTYRMGLIQTPEQLRFSYLAIIEGAKRLLSSKNVDNENNHMIGKVENGFASDDSSSNDDSSESLPIPPVPPHQEQRIQDVVASESTLKNRDCGGNATDTSMLRDVSTDHQDINLSARLGSQSALPQKTNDASLHSIIPDQSIISSCKTMQMSNDSSSQDTTTPKSVPRSKTSSESEIGDSVMRKRRRMEKLEKTNDKVQEMKAKQKKHEDWQKHRRSSSETEECPD